jgi:hypothetical protein
MTVILHLIRKQVIVTYDKNLVHGHLVSCQAGHPGGAIIEKKDTPNTGSATFSFGHDFVGPVEFQFMGTGANPGPGDSNIVNIP